jgi:2'-5' RNA ligase
MKAYHTAVAIVPPCCDHLAWGKIMDIRLKLRDKGYFRWPPHVNLFYPFVESEEFEESASKIFEALATVCPFNIELSEFGVFGGKASGVCFLRPDARDTSDESNPINKIHENLSHIFHESSGRTFTPHLTVGHYNCVNDARQAAANGAMNWSPISFHVSEIYIIQRYSEFDQFSVAWRIPLGGVGGPIFEGDEGKRFDHMPMVEDEWIAEVKESLSRKNNSSRSRK